MRDGYISVIICPLLATNEATEGPGGGHPMTADHAKPRHQSAHLMWHFYSGCIGNHSNTVKGRDYKLEMSSSAELL